MYSRFIRAKSCPLVVVNKNYSCTHPGERKSQTHFTWGTRGAHFDVKRNRCVRRFLSVWWGKSSRTSAYTACTSCGHTLHPSATWNTTDTSANSVRNSLNCCVRVSLCRERTHLYFAEAVRTALAIFRNPHVTQTFFHNGQQQIAAISVLQQTLPLLAAVDVVIPESLHPL